MRLLLVSGALWLLGSPVLAQSDLPSCDGQAADRAPASQAIAARDAVPDGLSSGDWTSIRAAYQSGRHQAFYARLAASRVARSIQSPTHLAFGVELDE